MVKIRTNLIAPLAPNLGYRFIAFCANFLWAGLLVGGIGQGVIGMFLPASSWAQEAPKFEVLCPSLTLKGKIEPGLSSTEKKLLCGGDDDAWKSIPFPQAKFNLQNFLQDRGHFHPVFTEVTPAAKDQPQRYIVDVGPVTRVTRLSADGAPENLRIQRKRKVVGEVLTPKLLGSVEQWVFQRVQALGYGCPNTTSEADPETGVIQIHVKTGPLQDLTSVIEESIPGVASGMLRRYDAFRLGKPFDGDLLTVTSNRIMSLNILQSTHFTVSCEQNGVVAHQQVTPGPPRLLTFGVGVDTEGLIQLRAAWRNARVGNHASLIDISTQVSSKDQRFDALGNWYFKTDPSRLYLLPLYEVRHQNENAYEVASTRAQVALATSWDNQLLSAQFQLGPLVELIRTLQGSGQGNPNSAFLEVEAALRVRNHDFEYWASDPRSGFNTSLIFDSTAAGFLSTTSVQRLNLTGEALLNLRDYDPPLVIFGLRGGLYATLSSERPGYSSRLPANYFWYLGGSADLRGFSRQSVPGQGAMTAFFLDPEVRFSTILPLNIEPFLFVDLGLTGANPLSFDSPLLYAPGLGLRYKSPFGVFRTTLARGFPINPEGVPSHYPGGWNFYFSFGEEF